MKKILYAEDNSGMRKMVSHYLGAVGFEVVVTTDGDEVIELAKNECFDVILLDVTMERVDGITAAIAIRQMNNSNKDAPIVGLTGRTEMSEVSACIDAGMDKVLAKPVDLDVLAEVMLNVCRGDAQIAEIDDQMAASNLKPQPAVYLMPKIIDLDVLSNYQKTAGAGSVEGILRDFSDSWPRKIGQLYSCVVSRKSIGFARALEELGAIAAGIGAGKVAEFAALAGNTEDEANCLEALSQLVKSCDEVQSIINALSEPAPTQIERLNSPNITKPDGLPTQNHMSLVPSEDSIIQPDFDFAKIDRIAS
ncbi:MAG: response regulator [Pseudomonadota bacterium]